MGKHLAARGLYVEIMENIHRRGSTQLWERVALSFFDKKGRPIIGKPIYGQELRRSLGMSRVQFKHALRIVRRRGLAIDTFYEDGAGSAAYYMISENEQQARVAALSRQRTILGHANTHNHVIAALPPEFDLGGLQVLPASEDAIRSQFGEHGVQMLRQLMDGKEGDQRALPPASS